MHITAQASLPQDLCLYSRGKTRCPWASAHAQVGDSHSQRRFVSTLKPQEPPTPGPRRVSSRRSCHSPSSLSSLLTRDNLSARRNQSIKRPGCHFRFFFLLQSFALPYLIQSTSDNKNEGRHLRRSRPCGLSRLRWCGHHTCLPGPSYSEDQRGLFLWRDYATGLRVSL